MKQIIRFWLLEDLDPYYNVATIFVLKNLLSYFFSGKGTMQDFFDSISNILRYFIQCDPRMPFYWHRWKKPILSLFAIFLIIFLYLELHSKNSEHHSNEYPLDVRWKADDEVTAIRYYSHVVNETE